MESFSLPLARGQLLGRDVWPLLSVGRIAGIGGVI